MVIVWYYFEKREGMKKWCIILSSFAVVLLFLPGHLLHPLTHLAWEQSPENSSGSCHLGSLRLVAPYPFLWAWCFPLCIGFCLLHWPLLVCCIMVDLFPTLFAWMLCIVDEELGKDDKEYPLFTVHCHCHHVLPRTPESFASRPVDEHLCLMCEKLLNTGVLILLHHLHLPGTQCARGEPYWWWFPLRSVAGLGVEVTAERLSRAEGIVERLNSWILRFRLAHPGPLLSCHSWMPVWQQVPQLAPWTSIVLFDVFADSLKSDSLLVWAPIVLFISVYLPQLCSEKLIV